MYLADHCWSSSTHFLDHQTRLSGFSQKTFSLLFNHVGIGMDNNIVLLRIKTGLKCRHEKAEWIIHPCTHFLRDVFESIEFLWVAIVMGYYLNKEKLTLGEEIRRSNSNAPKVRFIAGYEPVQKSELTELLFKRCVYFTLIHPSWHMACICG